MASFRIHNPAGDAVDRAQRSSYTFVAYCTPKCLLRREISKVDEIYVDATPSRMTVANLLSKLWQNPFD